MRGRPGRKGPNPLTRSFESNGPDVKIRGTAQHVAEKYLQLARDAQSSGDIVLAENLLQHAEHYFRLISAAQQQQQGGYGRTSYEQEAEAEDDDDFTGVPDRFASLAERLPAPSYAQQQPNFQPPANYMAASAPQPSFQPAQPQPQPFEERPAYPEMRHERPVRSDRVQFGGRNRDRGQEQNAEGGERPERSERPERNDRQPRFGFDRNRERPRFEARREREPSFNAEQPAAPEGGAGLPAFITAPPAVPRVAASEPTESTAGEERTSGRGGYAMTPRRRSRAPREEAGGEEPARAAGDLPLGE
ncbi:hypothetical protein DSM21852_06520 [Methylocystis bryophila]|nr:hypothetical protein DSM21852_06520 [Methylocystis bryophila]